MANELPKTHAEHKMDWRPLVVLCHYLFCQRFHLIRRLLGHLLPFFIKFTPATCPVKEDVWTFSENTTRQQDVWLFVDVNTYLAVVCE